jgi:hypothetical protein
MYERRRKERHSTYDLSECDGYIPSFSSFLPTNVRQDAFEPACSPVSLTPYSDACYTSHIYPSSTPLSLRLLKSSGSKNLLMVTSSARPFLLRVLSTKSRASCCAVAGSSGRVVMSLSRGSPGTIDQRSKTRERETWPCVWICGKVSILPSTQR